MGPFSEPPFDGLLCSPLNLVPKAGNPGKFRLILNLAFTYDNNSINANIPDSQAIVSYAPFDRAIQICQSLGQGCFVSKMGCGLAFRIFPISSLDLHLLGFTLENEYYINNSMVFRARSSCRIFETFTTAMEWALIQRSGWCTCTHYLDDFFLARGTYPECAEFMDTFQGLCDYIGAQLSPVKTEEPYTKLTFLRLQVNTVLQEVSIPNRKLHEALDMIRSALNKTNSKITVKAIQQLAGKLQFIAKGIPVGRPYIRHLYNLLKTALPKEKCNTGKKPHPMFKVKTFESKQKGSLHVGKVHSQ